MAIDTSTTDLHEILAAHAERRRVDPEVAKRAHERAEQVRREILQKHGVLDVAVDLIREVRDEA